MQVQAAAILILHLAMPLDDQLMALLGIRIWSSILSKLIGELEFGARELRWTASTRDHHRAVFDICMAFPR